MKVGRKTLSFGQTKIRMDESCNLSSFKFQWELMSSILELPLQVYVPQKPHKKHITIIFLKYTQLKNAFVFQ